MDELVRLEVELARRYLVDGWQSFAKNSGESWGATREQDRTKTRDNPPGWWHTLPQRILAASPHLQGGEIPWDVVQGFREKGMGLIEVLDMLEL